MASVSEHAAAPVRRRAPRDPEGRRRAIVAATVEVMRDVGVTRVSHRMVATKAGVPLSATSYYFQTIEDLLVAAVAFIVEDVRAYMAEWTARVAASDDIALTLAQLAHDYVADRERAMFEYEIYIAAARAPELEGLAVVWREEVPAFVRGVVDANTAHAVSLLLSGAMLESLAAQTDVDVPNLASMFRVLLQSSH